MVNLVCDFALLGVCIYSIYTCFVSKEGANKKIAHLYTKESYQKYSKYAGISSIVATVFATFIMLVDLGIVNMGLGRIGLLLIFLALILIPYIAFQKMFLVPVAKENGNSEDSEEDY